MKKSPFVALILVVLGLTVLSCQKELSEENGLPDILASGSLRDTFGECFPDSVHGTFYNGVFAGSDTAYVEVKVNVSGAGSYNIISDLQNGLQFSDSGYFAATGINTVFLKAIGTANLPISTVFTISFDSSVCSFIVDVKDSTGTGLGGNPDTTGTGGSDTTVAGDWSFSDTLATYTGSFDSSSSIDVGGTKFLTLQGTTTYGDTAMALGIFFPTGSIVPGTYTTAAGSGFAFIDATQTIYQASLNQDFTIIVTGYTNNVITGTFSGNVVNEAGETSVLSGGTFSATVQ